MDAEKILEIFDGKVLTDLLLLFTSFSVVDF